MDPGGNQRQRGRSPTSRPYPRQHNDLRPIWYSNNSRQRDVGGTTKTTKTTRSRNNNMSTSYHMYHKRKFRMLVLCFLVVGGLLAMMSVYLHLSMLTRLPGVLSNSASQRGS